MIMPTGRFLGAGMQTPDPSNGRFLRLRGVEAGSCTLWWSPTCEMDSVNPRFLASRILLGDSSWGVVGGLPAITDVV